MGDMFEELRVALEELNVAHEELQEQNEQLVESQVALEVEQRRYRNLFESAPDGYVITTVDGVIQEANRAAAKLLTVPQRFLVGKPLLVFVPELERRAFRHKINQLKWGEVDRLQEWEVLLYPRVNQPITVAITVDAVGTAGGTPTVLHWLIRDVTHRKQAEAKMQEIHLQNLQLQEANRLKSEFLRMVSHEFRTPLNAIIGFSRLLSRQKQATDSQASMIDRIHNNGVHLLSLISDVLDLAQMESGVLRLVPKAINLAELAAMTIEEVRILAEKKSLGLNVEIALHDPIAFNDGNRLRQVLVNLLDNAIKFTDSGRVSVRLAELEEAPDRLVLTVQDTGIGIEPDKLDYIFTAFQQVDQRLNRKFGGTGLGLAITRSIVQLMQGSITVESEVGKGSLFRVEFPHQISVDTKAIRVLERSAT